MVVLVALIHAIILTAIAFTMYKRENLNSPWYWPAFYSRFAAGICVGLIYTYYYRVSDTFVFYHEASKAADIAAMDVQAYLSYLFAGTLPEGLSPSEPRTLFFTRIVSVLCFFTGNNYWAIALWLSAFSFFGAWYLVCNISAAFPKARGPAIAAFLFMPSVVFWTSGVLKESVAMGSLFFLAGFFVKVWIGKRPSPLDLIIAAIALWLLWSLKYYYAGVFGAVGISALAYRFIFSDRLGTWTEVGWLTLLCLAGAIVSLLHPNFHSGRLLQVIVENNNAYVAASDTGDVMAFRGLEPSVTSVLLNAPWAILSGLFRPFVWEASGGPQVLAALENMVILIVSVAAIAKIRGYAASPDRLLTFVVVVYVCAMAVFLTLSAPNFGTLSRFRSGYISFFVFLVLFDNPLVRRIQRTRTRLVRKGVRT